MDLDKIYKAVDDDEMNSPLVSIVYELEKQGYKVKLEGIEVTSEDLEKEMFGDLEKATNIFEIELFKNSGIGQKFKLVFNDYHRFYFQPCDE